MAQKWNSAIVTVSSLALIGVLGGCAASSQQTSPKTTESISMQKQDAMDAINAAKAAYQSAASKSFALATTKSLIAQAESAYQAGHYAQAQQLANEAQKQAENSLNLYYLAHAKTNLENLKADVPHMTSTEKGQYQHALSLYQDNQGKASYDLTEKLLTEMQSQMSSHYTVRSGNTLWGIASKPAIYQDPFKWPLIYKANASHIYDPDLIYPGQQLTIPRNNSTVEINAAIYEAKHRGSYTLGQPTKMDRQYIKESAASFLSGR